MHLASIKGLGIFRSWNLTSRGHISFLYISPREAGITALPTSKHSLFICPNVFLFHHITFNTGWNLWRIFICSLHRTINSRRAAPMLIYKRASQPQHYRQFRLHRSLMEEAFLCLDGCWTAHWPLPTRSPWHSPGQLYHLKTFPDVARCFQRDITSGWEQLQTSTWDIIRTQ